MFRQSGITLTIILGAATLQYGVSFLLASWLRPSDYGDYEVAMALGSLLLIVSLHCVDKSLFRYLPNYMSASDWGHYRGFLRFHLSLAFGLALGMALVGTGLALVDSPSVVRGGAGLHRFHPLVFMLWVLPIAVFGNVLDKLPRIVQRMSSSLLPLQIVLPLVMPATLWGMIRLEMDVTDWHAVGAFGLS